MPHAYIGDPRQVDVPIAALLSDSYTQSRFGLIQPGTALEPTPGSPQTHGDTVYLTVADGKGNMVSWIQSLYMGFGSGIGETPLAYALYELLLNHTYEVRYRAAWAKPGEKLVVLPPGCLRPV